MKRLKLSAVGDILMIGPLLASAKRADSNVYDFDPIFERVAPLLRDRDLVIGNLETPLAGREDRYTRKNKRTGFSMFNAPDELAGTLKRSGFHLMTTANNHCLDRGEQGLVRTLQVLDEAGLAHTGTYMDHPGDDNHWIRDMNGIRVGVISYTKGMNRLSLARDKGWMVNRFDQKHPVKLIRHLRRLRTMVDAVIVCVHFGAECRLYPDTAQRCIVDQLLANGADVVLGCHPHVIQPMIRRQGRFATYSLGNFASTRLYRNPHTSCGLILDVNVIKHDNGTIEIEEVQPTLTWTARMQGVKGLHYRIVPIQPIIHAAEPLQSKANRELMLKVARSASARIHG